MPGSPFSVSGRRISLSHPDIVGISIGPATTLVRVVITWVNQLVGPVMLANCDLVKEAMV